MKSISIKTIMITILLLLTASCSEDRVEDHVFTKNEKQVRIKVSLPSHTKTTLNTDFTTVFNTGDAIGIFAVVRTTAGVQAYPSSTGDNYAQNKQWQLQADGSWAPATASDAINYPIDGTKLDFYAYYPYDPTLTDPANIALSVVADQTLEADFIKNDFLSAINANGMGLANYSTPVTLQFQHQLALVHVTVAGKQASVPAFTNEMEATLKGILPNTTFNLGTNTIDSASGTATDVMMRKMSDGTFCAIVPAQSIAAYSTLLNVAQATDFSFYYTPKTITTFEAGKASRWNLYLGWGVVVP